MLKDKIKEMWSKGLTRKQIVKELGCSIHTVHRHTRGINLEPNEKKQLVVCLRKDGYYIHEVMKITGLARQTVVQYSQGHKFDAKNVQKKIKKIKVMPRKKKKVKVNAPTALDQRAVLGKGVEAGVYTTGVKLRENRDEGRLVKFLYSDILPEPTIPISIRVKEDISDQEAIDRWGKKFKKKNWKLC